MVQDIGLLDIHLETHNEPLESLNKPSQLVVPAFKTPAPVAIVAPPAFDDPEHIAPETIIFTVHEWEEAQPLYNAPLKHGFSNKPAAPKLVQVKQQPRGHHFQPWPHRGTSKGYRRDPALARQMERERADKASRSRKQTLARLTAAADKRNGRGLQQPPSNAAPRADPRAPTQMQYQMQQPPVMERTIPVQSSAVGQPASSRGLSLSQLEHQWGVNRVRDYELEGQY